MDGSHRGVFRFRRTNDGDGRKILAQKYGWFRHDQVFLKVLGAEASCAHYVEHHVGLVDRIEKAGIGCVPGFVVPSLKMRDLCSANAEQDAQHFGMCDPLRELRVEAGAALLDGAEVKTSGVGDRLQLSGVAGIPIRARNRGVHVDRQRGDGRRKSVAKVRILRPAAVAGPPTGINSKLRQIGEPAKIVGARRFAAGQSAKLVEANGVRTLGSQICVDEDLVGEFVFRIVVNVLRHI